MEPGSLSPVQLWCPRPFGTSSQNQPRPPARKPPACPDGGGPACSENTPPAPDTAASPPPPAPPLLATAPGEEGPVLLDTWYVIKPGNTKEKVAFFVAHQCGAGRVSAMKVKGHWGSDSSQAKRRRRSHDPAKARPEPGRPEPGQPPPGSVPGEDPDLLSVAEMVALVEQRTALALQASYPRGGAPPAPVVFVSAERAGGLGGPGAPEGAERRPGDCSRVAEAVAQFEAWREVGERKDEKGGAGAGAAGEVRIAFRISSGRDSRSSPPGEGGGAGGGRQGCALPGGPGGPDKITCDLYQLISPSRDALPTNVEYLLARADGPGEPGSGGGEPGAPPPPAPPARDSAPPAAAPAAGAGFHVDVVVTGVVDQCVFLGQDGAKNVQEETVRLGGTPVPEEPPPPGQLFLLPRGPDEPPAPAPAPEAAPAPGRAGGEAEAGDPALCRLYRHVSHDFLEIRFKIQRLLEPRQYLLQLPDHVLVRIFSCLPTRALAALKCTCHYFKCVIETFGVRAADSRWSRDPLYREDPCKQCKKRYARGDVSLCRWHPKPYHHDLPYGRSYWMCCRRPDREAPGCRVGLHDNNWVLPCRPPAPERGRREDGR
ncbi:F-box only protein 46 [Tachyglossus aculeatus]|uniref:F-box only protein 46 n=1 Tax=Tachyglossus aculeatus TaxID=9261 RepID=UPI0018F3E862|nr:F-box only protein 46 [Tachyglossus aculeatus]